MEVDFRELREKIPLEEVLKRYSIKLVETGNKEQLKGRCPFPGHKEGGKPNSFSVNRPKNLWYCHSVPCREARGGEGGGDVIAFVKNMEGCDFREAGKKLQAWFLGNGKSVTETAGNDQVKPETAAAEEETENIPLTVKFKNFSGLKDVDYGHEYLRSRGFEKELCEQLGVGFFPGKGMMSGRIVFPIHNYKGELVAYAGRLVGPESEEKPRWMLPAGFHKKLELYNLHRVAKKFEQAIVCESFWGVLACTRAGYPNAVALMGRELSEFQEKMLLQFREVVLLLDGDEPGRASSMKIGARFLELSYPRRVVKVVFLPDGSQPDTLPVEELESFLL